MCQVAGSNGEDIKRLKISIIRKPYLKITLKGLPQTTSLCGKFSIEKKLISLKSAF